MHQPQAGLISPVLLHDNSFNELHTLNSSGLNSPDPANLHLDEVIQMVPNNSSDNIKVNKQCNTKRKNICKTKKHIESEDEADSHNSSASSVLIT